MKKENRALEGSTNENKSLRKKNGTKYKQQLQIKLEKSYEKWKKRKKRIRSVAIA